LGIKAIMKRGRRITVLVLLTLFIAAIMLLVLAPASIKGSVSVRFLTLTNDAAGKRQALFLATNSSNRLFVRGRSELECGRGTSNIISVLQVTNVDYLKPGQAITFAIPWNNWPGPWRLRFDYMGQFHRREAMVYESSWWLQRKGLVPDRLSGMTWLPRHEMYELTTEWVSDLRNAQPDGPANGSQPIRSETNRTSSAAGSRR
jgi:hypothetical protein